MKNTQKKSVVIKLICCLNTYYDVSKRISFYCVLVHKLKRIKKGAKMSINKVTELQLQVIINNNLYKKNIIDENTFLKVNERLLKMIKALQLT